MTPFVNIIYNIQLINNTENGCKYVALVSSLCSQAFLGEIQPVGNHIFYFTFMQYEPAMK